MIEYINLNKEYSKGLTVTFLKELAEELKAVLPLLEKYLTNQLYILKKVIEETEED